MSSISKIWEFLNKERKTPKRLNNVYSVFWAVIVVLVSIYLIYDSIIKSDFVQKKYYPNKYWSNYWSIRSEDLEKEIESNEKMIKIASIELEKIERTADLRLAETILNSNLEKKDAIEIEKKLINEEINVWLTIVKNNEKQLSLKKKELSQAKSELEKYHIILKNNMLDKKEPLKIECE